MTHHERLLSPAASAEARLPPAGSPVGGAGGSSAAVHAHGPLPHGAAAGAPVPVLPGPWAAVPGPSASGTLPGGRLPAAASSGAPRRVPRAGRLRCWRPLHAQPAHHPAASPRRAPECGPDGCHAGQPGRVGAEEEQLLDHRRWRRLHLLVAALGRVCPLAASSLQAAAQTLYSQDFATGHGVAGKRQPQDHSLRTVFPSSQQPTHKTARGGVFACAFSCHGPRRPLGRRLRWCGSWKLLLVTGCGTCFCPCAMLRLGHTQLASSSQFLAR